MRLQRLRTRRVKDREYHKWVLNPPGEVIAALGWSEGEEVEATAENGALIIRRALSKP